MIEKITILPTKGTVEANRPGTGGWTPIVGGLSLDPLQHENVQIRLKGDAGCEIHGQPQGAGYPAPGAPATVCVIMANEATNRFTILKARARPVSRRGGHEVPPPPGSAKPRGKRQLKKLQTGPFDYSYLNLRLNFQARKA